mgnify:CR=1 FL=1
MQNNINFYQYYLFKYIENSSTLSELIIQKKFDTLIVKFVIDSLISKKLEKNRTFFDTKNIVNLFKS